MIVTGQVEEAVYDQMNRMGAERLAGLHGFPPHGLVSKNDVPAQHGRWWFECQDIGRLVLAPELGIELFDMPVVSEDEGRSRCIFWKDMPMTLGRDAGPLDKLLYVAQRSPPAWIRNQNLSVGSGRAFHGVSGRSGEDQASCQRFADRRPRQYGRQEGDGQHQPP